MVKRIADNTGHKSTRQVLIKLYELLAKGADFEETRWLFDWDSEKATIENIPSATGELQALQKLALIGVVRLRVEENQAVLEKNHLYPTKTKFKDIKDYHISKVLFYKPETDNAYMGFDWAVWIAGFNYDKFIAFCSENGYNPSTRTSEALLKIQDTIPIIIISGSTYHLKPLRAGLRPQEIISYCLNDAPGQTVSLDKLSSKLNVTGISNLNQTLVNTQFGGKNGVLKPFVTVTAKSIQIRPTSTLTPEQQNAIISTATPQH